MVCHFPFLDDSPEITRSAFSDTHAPKRKGDEDEDDDFDPTQATKKKQKAKQPKPSQAIEAARNDPHTLTEHHEHVLSATFDLSFVGDGSNHAQGHGPSSSHPEAPLNLDFDDNPFVLSDGLDLDGFMLGDELARELGWGSPAKSAGRFGPLPFLDKDKTDLWLHIQAK